MITINTERGLVRIEAWSELLEVPGFEVDIDPKQIGLKEIIGSYRFPEKQKCGLSTCHQPHHNGYIVTTDDGRVTNIGKDCGKTHFLVDFEAMRRNFDRDIEQAERRESLGSFKAQIPDYLEYVQLLRSQPNGADWIYRQIQCLLNPRRGVPDGVVEQLRSMRTSRNAALVVSRYASEAEVQELEAAQRRKLRRPHYITEEIGRVTGVAALFPENDLRELLVIDLEQNLTRVDQLDIESLQRHELRQHVNWTTTVPSQIERAEVSIQTGQELLTQRNLRQLLQFAEGINEERAFEAFLSGLPDSHDLLPRRSRKNHAFRTEKLESDE